MEELKTVLVTGYAKAPQGTAMYERYKHSGVVLEIDIHTGIIVNAEFSSITNLANDYFGRMLRGYNLNQGIDNLIERISKHYFAPSQQSLIVAISAAYQRYLEKMELLYKNENKSVNVKTSY